MTNRRLRAWPALGQVFERGQRALYDKTGLNESGRRRLAEADLETIECGVASLE
jgi:hypothetical protein